MNIASITTTGITLNIQLTGLDYSVLQLRYSLIYGSSSQLQAGYQISPSLSSYTTTFTNIVASGEGLNSFYFKQSSTFVNNEEIVKSGTNNFQVTITSSGVTTLTPYSFSYFIYQPCPLYCTSCNVGCVSCLPSTLRSNPPNCQTCPQYMFVSANALNCQQCMSFCDTCTAASSCTTCLASSQRLNPPLCNQCPSQMFIQVNIVNCLQCAAQCDNCMNDAIYCVACLASTGRSNPPFCNQCQLPQYYLPQGALQCQICNNYCNGCINAAYQCQACAGGTQRLHPPLCINCPTQMFIQLSVANCQSCTSYCDNCQNSASNCITCQVATQRLNPPICTTCPSNMFILAAQNNCQQCNTVCNQCVVSAHNCISCNGLYRSNSPNCDQCSQPNYYIDVSFNDCQVCQSYCNGCATQSNNCIACWPFTITSLSSTCPTCPVNQFTLPSSMCSLNLATHVCSQIYNRDPTCNCLAGFYNSENSLSCLRCSSSCQTCITSATNCLICNASLFLLKPPICNVCMDGYFMLNGNCDQCSSICTACFQSNSTCLSCTSPRLNPPLCSCPQGYFNECKQTCGFQCSSCVDTSINCLTCAGNRINPPLCGCPDGSIQSSGICSECSLVQPTAQFSDDLTTINIGFKYKLLTQVSFEALLNEKTLAIIGSNPKCSVNLNIVMISIGTGATITVNSPIFINPDALQFANCNSTKTEIITPLVQMPLKSYPPSITFNQEVFTTSQCDVVLINIIDTKQSGSRSLNLISWSIISANNNIALAPLIKKWNSQSLQSSYVVLPENLKNQFTIQLMITYSNFIGLVSNSTIKISIQQESLQLNIQVPKEVYLFDTVQIVFLASLLRCDMQTSNETVTLQICITNSSSSFNRNFSIQSGSQEAITYQPFSLPLYSIYQLNASAQYRSQKIEILKTFQVIASDIIVNFLGGDQIIGINQQMKLEAVVLNPNNQSSVNDLTYYNTTWGCLDIATTQKCTNFSYNSFVAQLNTSNYQPFTSLYISIEVYDNQSNKQVGKNNITVKIVENEINQVKIVGNQYQLNSPMNIYDQADVTLYYQSQMKIDIDNLTYYAQYLDSSYQLNQIQFYSPYTSIILENFKESKDAKFKVTVYHPDQKGPSTATLNIHINMPPQQCKFSVFPRGAKFQVEISSCISESQPLSYQFIYYTTTDEFIQDSADGIITNGIKLTEYGQPSLITYLYGQNTSLIVGFIKDSFNGLSNITLSLKKYQLEPNLFGYMLKDEQQNLPLNIMFMLKYCQVNNLIIADKYFDRIFQTSGTFNQTDKKTQYIQQQLAFQRSLSNSQISSSLTTTNSFINNISSQITFLQDQQEQNLYNKNYQIQIIQLQAQLSDCTNKLSFLYEQSQLVQNRRMLDTSVQNVTQSITTAVSDVTDILGQFTKLNQNQKVIKTPQFNLSAQKFSTMNINQNFKLQVINESNQTVQFKNQNFEVNPYQNDSAFANPIKSPLIIPNLTGANNVQIAPANPVPISFPPQGNVEVSCASKVGATWSMDLCQIVKSSTTLQCLCQTLSPLLIAQALEFILGQFGNLFKNTILNKISSFSYEQSFFTYIIGAFITLYFVSMVTFYKKDQIDNCRVYPVKDLNSGNQIEENDNLNIPPNSGAPISLNVIMDNELTKANLILYTNNSIIGQVKSQQITKIQGFKIFIQNSHVLLKLYYRYDEQEPRVLRLRQICIFVLFGKNLAISIVIALSIFQTAYGIVFQLILSQMIKSKNQIAHSMGMFIAALLTGLCTYLIIASMALFSSAYNSNMAALTYLASLGADYFVSNVLVELAKYVTILKSCHQQKYYKIYDKILPKGLQEIVFGRILFKPETKAQI